MSMLETPGTVAETPGTVAETPGTVAETPGTVAETPIPEYPSFEQVHLPERHSDNPITKTDKVGRRSGTLPYLTWMDFLNAGDLRVSPPFRRPFLDLLQSDTHLDPETFQAVIDTRNGGGQEEELPQIIKRLISERSDWTNDHISEVRVRSLAIRQELAELIYIERLSVAMGKKANCTTNWASAGMVKIPDLPLLPLTGEGKGRLSPPHVTRGYLLNLVTEYYGYPSQVIYCMACEKVLDTRINIRSRPDQLALGFIVNPREGGPISDLNCVPTCLTCATLMVKTGVGAPQIAQKHGRTDVRFNFWYGPNPLRVSLSQREKEIRSWIGEMHWRVGHGSDAREIWRMTQMNQWLCRIPIKKVSMKIHPSIVSQAFEGPCAQAVYPAERVLTDLAEDREKTIGGLTPSITEYRYVGGYDGIQQVITLVD